MSNCKEDIHSLHAELIHKAADIQFQLTYDNNGDVAEIICFPNGKNVQRFLEQFLSLNGLPKKNQRPTGAKNNVNLTYILSEEFIPETLEVFLGGSQLNGDPTDPDRDFDIINTGPNTNKGFTIRLDAEQGHRLNCPPQQDESLYCNYSKRVTFNTKGGT